MKYYAPSDNKREVKDCTEKLITVFVFKGSLFDYDRKIQVLMLKSILNFHLIAEELIIIPPYAP